MKNKYFKKQPFSERAMEYLLSIPPSELTDPLFNFRGRCRVYFLCELQRGKLQ